MANAIYSYPKSSCNCYNCTQNAYVYDDSSGYPTNLSITNCQIPSSFQCYDNVPFRSDTEPTNKSGYVSMNPQVYNEKFSKDFQRVECAYPQSCPPVQYASKDPRLISVAHGGQVLTLDRPAFDSSVKLADLATDKRLDGYGQNYRTYSDINAGYINYYIDRSQEDPFFSPNFVVPANVSGTVYRDPMGALEPEYDWRPVKCNNPLDTTKDNYDYGLSWMQDTIGHREDILSKQMSLRNKQLWQPRWQDRV